MNLSFIPVKGTYIPFPPPDPHKTMRDHSPHTLDLNLLNLFNQLVESSTTLRSMTQWTPNSEHTVFHNSWDTGQCRSKWSVITPFLLHIQHQSTTTTFRLLKLSMAKILPKAAVQIKKLPFGGTYGFHNGFHGKKKTRLGGCKAL